MGDLVKLLAAIVVGKYMKGKDILDGEDGEMLGEKIRHTCIIYSTNSDGQATIDLSCKMRDSQVVIEG